MTDSFLSITEINRAGLAYEVEQAERFERLCQWESVGLKLVKEMQTALEFLRSCPVNCFGMADHDGHPYRDEMIDRFSAALALAAPLMEEAKS